MLSTFAHWAGRDPDKAALIFARQTFSYGQLAGIISHIAALIASRVGGARGVAVIQGDSLLEDWLLSAAARALGLDAACPKSLEQVRGMPLGPIALIALGAEASRAMAIPPEFSTTPRLVIPPLQSLAVGNTPQSEMPRGAAAGGQLLITTGTTGIPKAVLYPGAQEEARNEMRAVEFGYGRDTVYLASNFPLYTAVGFKNPAATWHRGGTVVFDTLSYDAPLKLPDTITSAVLIPASIEAFARSPRVADRVRERATIRLSGGFLSAGTWRNVRRALGLPIEVYFASTEIMGVMMRSKVRSVEDLTWLQPDRGRAIEVVDEDGAPCPVDTEGHLRVQLTEFDAHAYLGDPVASARTFRDGFFYPGDMAVRRADGRIRILGRTADVINVQGHKIATAPIEQAIQEAIGAPEVCVFSGLDQAGNDQVVVACRRPEALSESESAAVTRLVERLGPVRIIQLAEFPLSVGAMRKTDRAALRRLAFA